MVIDYVKLNLIKWSDEMSIGGITEQRFTLYTILNPESFNHQYRCSTRDRILEEVTTDSSLYQLLECHYDMHNNYIK